MSDRKYSIGFVIIGLILMLLVSSAYQISYHAAMERAEEEKYSETKDNETQESIETEGEALKNECYYLMEKNGYVVVYLGDKKTVYEYTSIEVETLPVTLQNEVKNGKYMENMEELYGFLENYSS
ncbi:MAG: hypothetical protein Q4C52_02190 [Eubacteriales bacterium]|nr:hypothetical protein [Eubacteriales bacterium]